MDLDSQIQAMLKSLYTRAPEMIQQMNGSVNERMEQTMDETTHAKKEAEE